MSDLVIVSKSELLKLDAEAVFSDTGEELYKRIVSGAQPVSSEPCAWVYKNYLNDKWRTDISQMQMDYYYTDSRGRYVKGIPLYATPQPAPQLPQKFITEDEFNNSLLRSKCNKLHES